MKTTPPSALTAPLKAPLIALLAAALLAGCATPPAQPKNTSYVALLASPDGSVGRVLVRGSKGEQQIDQSHYAALLDGSEQAFPVDDETLHRDCGEAMAARPELPEHFILYFESGDAKLTAESQLLIPQILASIEKRATVDMSVIGHSDTVGRIEVNEALSLKRAQTVADLIKTQGMKVEALSVESHGKRNLLVPTPDETPEPRNRRVEISIR
jgi:outer membrane protein OmpA-like peptidoglycan-associated protein